MLKTFTLTAHRFCENSSAHNQTWFYATLSSHTSLHPFCLCLDSWDQHSILSLSVSTCRSLLSSALVTPTSITNHFTTLLFMFYFRNRALNGYLLQMNNTDEICLLYKRNLVPYYYSLLSMAQSHSCVSWSSILFLMMKCYL